MNLISTSLFEHMQLLPSNPYAISSSCSNRTIYSEPQGGQELAEEPRRSVYHIKNHTCISNNVAPRITEINATGLNKSNRQWQRHEKRRTCKPMWPDMKSVASAFRCIYAVHNKNTLNSRSNEQLKPLEYEIYQLEWRFSG